MSQNINNTKNRYNKWVVQSYKGGNTYACVCECGRQQEITWNRMLETQLIGCGCGADEYVSYMLSKNSGIRHETEFWCVNIYIPGFLRLTRRLSKHTDAKEFNDAFYEALFAKKDVLKVIADVNAKVVPKFTRQGKPLSNHNSYSWVLGNDNEWWQIDPEVLMELLAVDLASVSYHPSSLLPTYRLKVQDKNELLRLASPTEFSLSERYKPYPLNGNSNDLKLCNLIPLSEEEIIAFEDVKQTVPSIGRMLSRTHKETYRVTMHSNNATILRVPTESLDHAVSLLIEYANPKYLKL